jgi:hypothetical protein
MLGELAWLTVGVPIQPKGVRWVWSQGFVQVSQVFPHRFCMDLTLCTGALSCWNRKGPSPNCCHNVGSTKSSRMSSYAVVLRFLFTGTKWFSPRPLFLLHQTLQLALCIGAGSVLLASAKPRFVRRNTRWWSVIHHSRERVSTPPESNGGGLSTTLDIA